jgi:regulator of RNase E activity RraB
MADNWTSYLWNVNGKLASIFINLGLAGNAPIASKSWLLWVWVYFKAPRPDGLSDGDEAPTLFLIEDALNELVCRECRALPCGRITTEGRREFYFYGETKDGFRRAVQTALAGFHGYKRSHGEQEDLQWKQYFDVLYPPREAFERIRNRDLLEVLVKQGDVLTAERDVQHWLFFPSKASRASFRKEAESAGFRTHSESLIDGDRPFAVSIVRTQAVEQSLIDATVIELLRLALRFDGDYDGWETPVTTH